MKIISIFNYRRQSSHHYCNEWLTFIRRNTNLWQSRSEKKLRGSSKAVNTDVNFLVHYLTFSNLAQPQFCTETLTWASRKFSGFRREVENTEKQPSFPEHENVSKIARWKEQNTPFLLSCEVLVFRQVSLGSQLLKWKFRSFTYKQVFIVHCNLLTFHNSRGWLRKNFRFGDVRNILSVREKWESSIQVYQI